MSGTFGHPLDGAAFLVVYATFIVVCALLVRVLQMGWGLVFDGRADATVTSLRIGDIPGGDDVYLVAVLTGRLPQALLVGARVEGWLAADGSFLRDARPRSHVQRRLFDAMAARTTSRTDERGGLDRELALRVEALGLKRGAVARTGPAVVSVVVGAALFAWATSMGQTGVAVDVLHAICALVFLGLALSTSPLTGAGERYVAWLRDATEALRVDVRSGALGLHDAAVLTCALETRAEMARAMRMPSSAALTMPPA
jgi:hypothetical protein